MFKSFLKLKNKVNRHRDLIFGRPDQKLANPSRLRPTPLNWAHRVPSTLLTFDPVGQKSKSRCLFNLFFNSRKLLNIQKWPPEGAFHQNRKISRLPVISQKILSQFLISETFYFFPFKYDPWGLQKGKNHIKKRLPNCQNPDFTILWKTQFLAKPANFCPIFLWHVNGHI